LVIHSLLSNQPTISSFIYREKMSFSCHIVITASD
jgi:hypothetical protein